ncbi:MAG TPA: hypothetical protein DCM32_05630 [Xanthomonadaceae bacterium]|jgi:hypothetical protein|nr:hypothetical protein [Xanthomonadaceae bacterium]
MIDRWDTRPYLQRLGDATSQWVNVALANGMPDESLSGRAWRNTALRSPPRWQWRIVRTLAEVLFWPIDQGQHCRRAFEQDLARAGRRAAAADNLTYLYKDNR